MIKTKFYELLVRARIEEEALVFVVDKIMPMINKFSRNKKKKIDEDLRSYLIECAIAIIKNEDFAEKLSKEKIL